MLHNIEIIESHIRAVLYLDFADYGGVLRGEIIESGGGVHALQGAHDQHLLLRVANFA